MGWANRFSELVICDEAATGGRQVMADDGARPTAGGV